MKRIRDWWRHLFHGNRDEVAAAAARLDADSRKIARQAARLDKSAQTFETGVQRNHISASIAALLRGSK